MGKAIYRPLRPQVVLVLLGLSWCHLQTASACKAGHVADGSSLGLVAFRRLTEHPTVSAEAVQAALKRIAGVGWWVSELGWLVLVRQAHLQGSA